MAMPGGPAASGGGTSQGKLADAMNAGVQAGAAQWIRAQTEGDSRVPGSRPGDTDAERRAGERNSWETALPRGIRESIQSGQKRSLPREYEQRLKTYFDNLD